MEQQEKQQDDSLEMLFGELDEIIAKMEAPEIALEDAFALYEQGMGQIRRCNAKLDLVEKKMLMISKEGIEVPFEQE